MRIAPDQTPAIIGPTKCRCPKCRSQRLTATEITEALMDFNIADGQIVRAAGSDEYGEIIGLRLRCNSCDHHWTPRRARMINQLVAEAA